MNHHTHLLEGTYNELLVTLSFLIAITAAYASFGLANRVKISRAKFIQFWLISGAFTLGVGIWSMHFIAMLAFHLPVDVSYNLWFVLLSILGAITGCYIGLYLIHKQKKSMKALTIAGSFMGAGIVFMHYLGMMAMEPIMISYDPFIVFLSILIAVAASNTALWLGFYSKLNEGKLTVFAKLICSTIMGIAIAGMHYTGMQAASFSGMSMSEQSNGFALNPIYLSAVIIFFIACLFTAVFLTIFMDRRVQKQEVLKWAFFESALDAILVIDEKRHVLSLNYAAETLFSLKASDVIGSDVVKLLPFYKFSSLQDGRTEHSLLISNREVTVEITVMAVAIEETVEYMLYIRNMTQEREAEKTLIEAKNRYENLFYSSPLAIMVHREKEVVSVNDAMIQLLGVSEDQLVGKSLYDFFSSEQVPDIKKGLKAVKDRKDEPRPPLAQLKMFNALGKELFLEVKSTLIQINGETLFQTVTRDVTEQKKAQESLQYMAFHDMLTDLPNRSMFSNIVEKSIDSAAASGKKLHFLFLDLDRFKQVNDTLGHHAGDQLMLQVVDRMKSCLRNQDVLSRFGGDEFLVLLHDRTDEEVKKICQSLNDCLSTPFVVLSRDVYLGVSIGVSLFPKDGSSLEVLVRHADLAMYEVKKQGRNHYLFYQKQMQVHTTRRMRIEDGLRKAFELGEMELHYQPKVNIQSGHIVGVEALIRWTHAEMGVISPAEFIPIAEETGVIVTLTKWVLKKACHQNKYWQLQGLPPLKMSVNISSVDFGTTDFVDYVLDVLREVELEPRYLELEITESVTMKHVEQTIEKLQILKDAGVFISIDDFGSGYSSFSYIQKLPIHTLKIDRSFIKDLDPNTTEVSIVRAIITLAKSLQLSVVAEGVEEVEQVELLHKEKCDEVQGYYFSKPISAEEFYEKFHKIEEKMEFVH
ncbi:MULTISPECIES: bifunctional diguanylate cyclase/phosphodiesterase [Priestia]|uniref:bifunctional diguanylate cyclase/phosphodiesterase n=1 Tax=Priestia TaxID=2800373 RepID=UPI000BF9446A|nr:EAL domain-containing protein [Priestia aryabhattai]MBK0007524.1 EAL domain-containing protein [Bacillus sp. S35]MCM3640276.1 EAL domain-containing protein [Priestia aryabhattai]PFW77009.1 diguanylate cyclase [Priestia aryabhattai]